MRRATLGRRALDRVVRATLIEIDQNRLNSVEIPLVRDDAVRFVCVETDDGKMIQLLLTQDVRGQPSIRVGAREVRAECVGPDGGVHAEQERAKVAAAPRNGFSPESQSAAKKEM